MVVSLILTILIPLIFLIDFVIGLKVNKDNGEDNFLSLNFTNAVKSICCIIVVMVHIPTRFGNFLQDAIGSFGFVAVTIFFCFVVDKSGCFTL